MAKSLSQKLIRIMNDKPQKPWQESVKSPAKYFGWFGVVISCALLICGCALFLLTAPWKSENYGGITAIIWIVLIAAEVTLAVFVAREFLRNFRRFFFALVCLATFIGLVYAEEDLRGWLTWSHFKRDWEAKGINFDIAGVAPAPVAGDKNFALTPIAYSGYGFILTRDGKRIPNAQRDTNFVQRLRMPITVEHFREPEHWLGNWQLGQFSDLQVMQKYYRDAAAKTNEFAVPATPQSPGADILLALGKYDATIEELRAASVLPESRFPLEYDYDDPGEILLPHLAALKQCSEVLQLRCLAELANGQNQKATDDLKLMLQLTGKVKTEPFLISHLVRIAMLQMAFQPLWEGLARHQWTDSQLVALDGELAKIDFAEAYVRAMKGELAMQHGEINYLRRNPGRLPDLLNARFSNDGWIDNAILGLLGRVVPTGWSYQNEYRSARLMVNYFIPVANEEQGTFSPDLGEQGSVVLMQETKSPSPFNFIEGRMLPALTRASLRFAFAQASVNMARIALALEHYRLAHGDYPAALAKLAPDDIQELPQDVIGGQPLKYRREADGLFTLYSVGWNKTDDGGVFAFRAENSARPDLEKGDWVWRYPAK